MSVYVQRATKVENFHFDSFWIKYTKNSHSLTRTHKYVSTHRHRHRFVSVIRTRQFDIRTYTISHSHSFIWLDFDSSMAGLDCAACVFVYELISFDKLKRTCAKEIAHERWTERSTHTLTHAFKRRQRERKWNVRNITWISPKEEKQSFSVLWYLLNLIPFDQTSSHFYFVRREFPKSIMPTG